jgi:nucleoside-diphosphate-sugar epimerase
MVKILITGASSFIGANFRNQSKFKEIDEISLLDRCIKDIDFTPYDVVLHLAAIVHQSKKIADLEYFRVNRDLCLGVANLAKNAGIKQFVFLSTLKVYGKFTNANGLRNENSDCYPDDAYGKSKYEAEIGLMKLEDANFTISIIRTPLVYGEGVKANMANLIKLVDRVPILPFGKIDNKRNFTYTENLTGFIDRIISKRASGVFIAMDDFAVSTTDLVNYISKYLGKKNILVKLPAILFRICSIIIPETLDRLYGSLEFENSRTKQTLNFIPPFSTEEGIKNTVNFYLANKK